MQRQDSPPLVPAQTSPAVVPKYTPGRECRSVHIAWRSTVNQACERGSPRSKPPPALARVGGHVHRRAPIDGGARPDGAPVHRQHPDAVGVGGVQHDRESDVAHFPRHRLADALPATPGAIEAVDAAMILLIEPIGHQWVLHDAVRVVPEGRGGIGQEVGRTAFIERRPARSGELPASDRLSS